MIYYCHNIEWNLYSLYCYQPLSSIYGCIEWISLSNRKNPIGASVPDIIHA